MGIFLCSYYNTIFLWIIFVARRIKLASCALGVNNINSLYRIFGIMQISGRRRRMCRRCRNRVMPCSYARDCAPAAAASVDKTTFLC